MKNQYCPACGLITNNSRCSCGWSRKDARTNTTPCSCGRSRQIAHECWGCYDTRTGSEQDHRLMLYKKLCDIGLAKQRGESKHEYATRCRQWLRKHGGIGAAIERNVP